MSTYHLPDDIRHLPIPARMQLVDSIWDSIVEDQATFELTDVQKAELDRRIAEYEADPSQVVSWDDVKRQLLGDEQL